MLQNVKLSCFYRFWVIMGKPTAGGGRVKLPPTQIKVKTSSLSTKSMNTGHSQN